MAYNQLPLDNNSGNTSYSVPNPSILEVKKYLKSWSELENYKLQEDALDKLFFESAGAGVASGSCFLIKR